MSHVRTDNPWSHGCRLTSRASAGRHQAPDAGARLVARPIQDDDHLFTCSSGNEQPFLLDGRLTARVRRGLDSGLYPVVFSLGAW
jgi:hypothetical protein